MRKKMNVRPVEILLVEDNPADAALTKKAFAAGKMINTLTIIDNGLDVLPYLKKEGRFRAATTPDIILLDLNLPGKDGRELIEEIKSDEHLKIIPVVVMSTSKADEDILKTYKLHANSYITKPIDFNQFKIIVESIENFWFSIVTLPREAHQAR